MLELFQENKVTVEKKQHFLKFSIAGESLFYSLLFFLPHCQNLSCFFCNHLVFIIHNSIAFDIC